MDKFISPCKQPEGIERELLVIFGEECAEVIHRLAKALRFGLAEVQPGQGFSNEDRVLGEYSDIVAVFEVLQERGMFAGTTDGAYRSWVEAKKKKVNKFLQSGSLNSSQEPK